MEKTITTANQDLTSHKTIPVEVLVGWYDNCYKFQMVGEDKRAVKNMFFTTGWDKPDFYNAGCEAAGWLFRAGNPDYKILNGHIQKLVYNISQEKAKAMIRARADDLSSARDPPHHFERVECRALMPEQFELFNEGLEHRLKILRGEISEDPKIPERGDPRDNYIAVSGQANAYSRILLNQKFSKDIDENVGIQKQKLIDAVITGELDLSSPRIN